MICLQINDMCEGQVICLFVNVSYVRTPKMFNHDNSGVVSMVIITDKCHVFGHHNWLATKSLMNYFIHMIMICVLSTQYV